MWRSVLAIVCLATSAGGARAQAPVPNPVETQEPPAIVQQWPTHGWSEAALPADADARSIGALMAEAFEGPRGPLGETRAVVVIQDGKLVLERYAKGYGPDTALVSWSVAKSFTQAFVGAAALQGLLDPEAPMGSPYWGPRHPLAGLNWRTWLQMVDGQRYVEIDAPSIPESDAARKLFGPGKQDVARFCAGLPVIHAPGAHWNYNSCGIVLTADALTRRVVAKAASPQDRRARMSAWLRNSLLDPLGMHSAVVEFDRQGLFYGSALIYASARDFAKFGYLYLNDGLWEGRRLLPEGWVAFASTPGPAANSDGYGAGWWLTPEEGRGKPYESLIDGEPRDAYSAQGFEGQFIVVVPSKRLVVVRLGLTPNTRNVSPWMTPLVRAFGDRPQPEERAQAPASPAPQPG